MQLYHIGRSRDNDIVIDNPSVSRKHGQLYFDAGQAYIIDLESTNGTFVNGRRVHGKQPLTNSDVVRIGTQVFPWRNYLPQGVQEVVEPSTYIEPPVESSTRASTSQVLSKALPYVLAISILAIVVFVFVALFQDGGIAGGSGGESQQEGDLEGKWIEVADDKSWILFESDHKYTEGYDDLKIFEGTWKTKGKDSLLITKGEVQIGKTYAVEGDKLTIRQRRVEDNYKKE